MKQTASVSKYGYRVVGMCIRNAGFWPVSITVSANIASNYATFGGTNHDFHTPIDRRREMMEQGSFLIGVITGALLAFFSVGVGVLYFSQFGRVK